MENQTFTSETLNAGERPKRGFLNFISWSSIFAGLTIAFIIQFLLTLLGVGIGMAAIQPLSEENPMEGLGTGAIIWWIVTVLLSLFAGGYVAGKWAGALNTYSRTFHGILTWGLYTILSFYLLTTAVGNIIGGVGSIIGKTLTMAGQGASGLAPIVGEELKERGITKETMEREIELLIRQSGIAGATSTTGNQREDASPEIAQAFKKYKESANEVDREALINVIVARTGKSRAEAEAEVNRLDTRIKEITVQVEEDARVAADKASRTVSKAAFIIFIGLLIGAIAAAVGAAIAKRDYDTTNKIIGV